MPFYMLRYVSYLHLEKKNSLLILEARFLEQKASVSVFNMYVHVSAFRNRVLKST